MKRLVSFFICTLLLALSLSSCIVVPEPVTTLYVYNWGEYISDGSENSYDSNAAFEEWYYEKYGERVVVNYSTYSSNESLYAKITSGSVSYDVICPSDYMVERLKDEGYLAELDHSNFENLGNLRPEFFGNNAKFDYYDEGGRYSIPYFYGMIGVIYNTSMVDEDEDDLGSWSLMWDEDHRGNILQFNNSRDAFGTAQYYLGVDVNSDDIGEWRAALELLKDQKDIVQGYVMDEIYNKMENGSAAIAAYYAGDFLAMYENNEDLEFFYPKEGTNLYVDAMCIPKSSKNKLIAERYIDFMLSEEPATENALYTYYASPNRLVYESEYYREEMNLIKEDAFDLMYDEESIETATYYVNLTDEKLALINSLWEELKSDIDVGLAIYIICIAIVVVLTSLFTFLFIRKRYRDKY
ncbi:MAG: spermidine/putrescine ABC transporter substrate-binding protein [Ruminococcaceae bacterium]|nr:spermidine/putrescine ABC transporter substrate-binding protein [Oscillospiraceae bacterium]